MKRKKKQVNVVWEVFYSGNKKIKHWVQKKNLQKQAQVTHAPIFQHYNYFFVQKCVFMIKLRLRAMLKSIVHYGK